MKRLLCFLLALIFIFSCSILTCAETITTQIGESVDYDVNGDGKVNWLDRIALFVDPYVLGDADNDGDVDISDYSMIKSYIQLGSNDKIDKQADANEDGAIDAFDLFEIDKYVTLGKQTVEIRE